MKWYLKSQAGTVHAAVQEGGGSLVIMMTACGLHVRWDLPHQGWERARYEPPLGPYSSHVTCRRCLAT